MVAIADELVKVVGNEGLGAPLAIVDMETRRVDTYRCFRVIQSDASSKSPLSKYA